MSKLLPSIISKEQSAFVKGRHIIENIALTQELVHDLGRKSRGSNVILKLDMAKEYDRIEWDFLAAVLKRFGFDNYFVDKIDRLITNCWFSVAVNGDLAGFFKSSRGLRQGDPIAPILFILAQESLSRLLKDRFLSGKVGWCWSKEMPAHISSSFC